MRRMQNVRLAATAALVTALIAACSAQSTGSRSADHRPEGGIATLALLPGTGPNWIFPFASRAYDSLANYQDFMDLMYRPLYLFGGNDTGLPRRRADSVDHAERLEMV